MKITAKFRCAQRLHIHADCDVVYLYPDYTDGANAEWAYSTPAGSITLNVRPEVPFEVSKVYTLTFDDGE